MWGGGSLLHRTFPTARLPRNSQQAHQLSAFPTWMTPEMTKARNLLLWQALSPTQAEALAVRKRWADRVI